MRILIGIGIFFLSSMVMGQSSLSLEQAQKYALEHNLEYQNASLEVKIAKKKVWETTAIGLPQVNGEFNFNHFMDVQAMPFPTSFTDPDAPYGFVQMGLPNNMDFGITASQLVFSGSYIIGLRAAKSYVALSEQQVDQKEIDIKEKVANAYYLVLASKENIKVMQENVTSMEQLHNETKALYDEGMVELLEVDQLSLNLSNLKNSLVMAEQTAKSVKMLLNYHLGMKPTAEPVLTDSLESIVTKIDPSIAEIAFNINDHSSYKLLTTKEKLDFLAWKNEQARSLPTISAFYNNKQAKFGNDLSFSEMDAYEAQNDKAWIPQQLVGVKVSMPLFTSMQGSARMSQAKLKLEQTKNEKMMLEQALTMQASTAKDEYISTITQYKNAKENVDLTKSIYDKTVIKYKEGLVSSFELNQAKTQQLMAEGSYIQSIINVLNKKLALDKAYNTL